MALARIITRSEACSRELAVDLLSRGYMVEIVSPDAVPNHKADLELRVDAKSGERLTASVIVNDGERSTSLDFVRDLKVPSTYPMPVGTAVPEIISASSPEVRAESPSTPVSSLPTAVAVRRETGVPSAVNADQFTDQQNLFSMSGLNRWNSDSNLSDSKISFASSKIAKQGSYLPLARPSAPSRAASIPPVSNKTGSEPQVASRPVTQSRPIVPPFMQESGVERGPSRLGIIAASMASVALLLALAFGLSSRYAADPAKSATMPTSENLAPLATDNENSAQPVAPAKQVSGKQLASKAVAPSVPLVSSKESARAKTSRSAKSPSQKGATVTNAVTVARQTKASQRADLRRHTEDLIARDTVTYLDQSAKKAAANKPAAGVSHPRSHRNGEVAENTVIYLNGTHAPNSRTVTNPAAK